MEEIETGVDYLETDSWHSWKAAGLFLVQAAVVPRATAQLVSAKRFPRPEFFVFMDVHEDFLDRCGFDLSNDVGLYHKFWEHLPASRHAGSGVLSLSDGHVEIHRWRDNATLRPVNGTNRPNSVFAPGSQDFHFVWQRATKNKFEP